MRITEERKPDESEADHELRVVDCAHAFFTTCHHLTDWLGNDSDVPLDKPSVERLTRESEWLRRCADVANGSKHAIVGKGQVSSGTRALLQEDGVSRILLEDGSGVLLLEGAYADVATKEGTRDAVQAADECISEWDRILREIGVG